MAAKDEASEKDDLSGDAGSLFGDEDPCPAQRRTVRWHQQKAAHPKFPTGRARKMMQNATEIVPADQGADFSLILTPLRGIAGLRLSEKRPKLTIVIQV